ncbi:hypothetical protein JQ617_08185 [Bradyrhizobium sp. KB893862 SZCCT0404]|uniref:hypothetical protein n=1 Tax=Bradyrhizobium sp. KB893862 SZCCT0404 TaxID=2807672 RepID=UPI001BACABD8|nr:hypothetical protein [Bradyrhizobium sp. KB893862 SZCCT0404]MBR1173928.1 hypothetical protein [Bradyrhizobium sp. KB893862 SZCCT0404]
MKATSHTNLFSVDAPKAHDIEAVRPHVRKHMRGWKLLINGSEVTINGTTPKDAMKRFNAMTSGEVAYVLPTKKGKRA